MHQQHQHRQAYSSQQLRGPTHHDLTYFRSILSPSDRHIISALPDGKVGEPSSSSSSTGLPPSPEPQADELTRYNRDWTGHYHGSSQLILRPKSTVEVSSILRYCHENFIGVVPQGGNTGLCGGATPIQNEIILSLEDMNTIYHIDKHSGILTCDAGVILQNLQDYATDNGRLFPSDIGSKGTCQIGGNVSTNAGGQYLFRFGGLHGTVMGLEVVLPDGRVMQFNMNVAGEDDDDGTVEERKTMVCGTHRKDNTGYDLKHLFIGAEGTLGIVTKVAIVCPALPTSKNAALLVCSSYEHVLQVLQTAHEELGEVLSAMELMDDNTLQFVQQHGFSETDGGSRLLQDMLESDSGSDHAIRPLYLLVETQGSNSDHDSSKMDIFLTRLFASNTIQNGFLASDFKQMNEMWRIRESCNPSVARAGCVYKFDVSIPIEEYMDVAWELEREFGARFEHSVDLKVCVWGHVADGNAHINVVTPGRFDKDYSLTQDIETVVYDTVRKRSGSISAEHGLGQSKNEELGRIKEKNVLDVMVQIKALFDPHGIMNPGKFLPRTSHLSH